MSAAPAPWQLLLGQAKPQDLLEQRKVLSEQIAQDPYRLLAYHKRALAHHELGYPDLASMDAYKVLLLVDEIEDESGESHDEAVESFELYLGSELSSSFIASLSHSVRGMDARHEASVIDGVSNMTVHTQSSEDRALKASSLSVLSLVAPVFLAYYLALCGSLRSSMTFINNALKRDTSCETAIQLRESIILPLATKYFESKNLAWDPKNYEIDELPDRSLVRREIYEWNHHETRDQSLEFLNSQMAIAAPKLEVRQTELPRLSQPSNGGEDGASVETKVTQLGVFAKSAIKPGEQVLLERSLLTANCRLHEPLCDACGATLPEETSQDPSVQDHAAGQASHPCPECQDVIFCSAKCLSLAQESYHPSVCGSDAETMLKDVPPVEAADALYTQLLFRAMAMSATQEMHPLDLAEVKYIWGDFEETPGVVDRNNISKMSSSTFPFSFNAQILQPLHLLEQMGYTPFNAPDGLAETWVYNTLYAKFRGTASARISPRDGRPEVAAVHPLWCLANHSCDPNVKWEWAGEIQFFARDHRKEWKRIRQDGTGIVEDVKPAREGGIAANEEILNHYVDIDLAVRDRREWGIGALGGFCKCERCKWESMEE